MSHRSLVGPIAVMALCLSLAIPRPALAADTTTTGAGFVAQSVFFSHTPIVEGASVLIYASVINTSNDAFSGEAVFTDANKEIGSVAVSLSPGEARMVSISWVPTSGQHKVSATLTSANGVPISSTGQTTADADVTVTVQSKPTVQPTPDTVTVQPSTNIQQAVESFSPPVAKTLQPAFVGVDSVRQAAAQVIDDQIQQTKKTIAKQTTSAVTSKKSTDTSAAASTTNSSVSGTVLPATLSVYAFMLSILQFIIGSALLFYPLFVALLVWLLYKLYRRMTRPYYGYY